MQFVIDMLVTWWQFTVVGILIIIGWIINRLGVDQDEELIGFEYNDCCWKTRLVARRFIKGETRITILEDDPLSARGFKAIDTLELSADSGIFFEFQLKGLSTLGRRLDSLLELSIPGYRNREDLIGQ